MAMEKVEGLAVEDLALIVNKSYQLYNNKRGSSLTM
jgi:hypothetical protein